MPELTKIRIIVSHGSILEVEEALHVLAEVEAFLASVHNQYHTIDIEVLKAMALLRVGRTEHANDITRKSDLTGRKERYDQTGHGSLPGDASPVQPGRSNPVLQDVFWPE